MISQSLTPFQFPACSHSEALGLYTEGAGLIYHLYIEASFIGSWDCCKLCIMIAGFKKRKTAFFISLNALNQRLSLLHLSFF